MQKILWKIEQFIEMLIGVIFVSLGLSLMIKSNLGQTALTAFTQCLSLILIIMSFYFICILGQIFIQGKNLKKSNYYK